MLDVKANNVVVEFRQDADQLVLEHVQLADLEDAFHVPPGEAIYGLQSGNYMWRSPEAHTSHYVNKPSDIFSFGIVVIRPVPCGFLALLLNVLNIVYLRRAQTSHLRYR